MDRWFDIQQLGQEIYCIRESVHVQSFLINGSHSSLLIDTGMGFLDIKTVLAPLLKPELKVVNTHWHFDHIGGNPGFKCIHASQADSPLIRCPIPSSVLVPFYIDLCRSEKIPLPAKTTGFNAAAYAIPSFQGDISILNDGDEFNLGQRKITTIATPGHTRGSLCFYDETTATLFSGDFLYDGTLYAQFKDSDPLLYKESLVRLSMDFPDIQRLCPSHNTLELGPNIVHRAQSFFQALESGRTQYKVSQEPWGPCHRHQGEGVEMFLPLPGTEGLDPVPGLPGLWAVE